MKLTDCTWLITLGRLAWRGSIGTHEISWPHFLRVKPEPCSHILSTIHCLSPSDSSDISPHKYGNIYHHSCCAQSVMNTNAHFFKNIVIALTTSSFSNTTGAAMICCTFFSLPHRLFVRSCVCPGRLVSCLYCTNSPKFVLTMRQTCVFLVATYKGARGVNPVVYVWL
jgi:hypothetical protein